MAVDAFLLLVNELRYAVNELWAVIAVVNIADIVTKVVKTKGTVPCLFAISSSGIAKFDTAVEHSARVIKRTSAPTIIAENNDAKIICFALKSDTVVRTEAASIPFIVI